MTLVVPGAYWRLLSWRRRARRGPWQLWQASRFGVGTFELPVMELIRRTPAGDETMRVKLSSGAKSVQDFSLTDTGMVQVMNDPGERHGVLLPLGSDHRPFAFIRPVTHRQDRRWLGSTSELGTIGATPIDGSAVLQRLRDVLGRRLGGRATTELTRDQHGRERLRLRPVLNPRACPIEITYNEDCIYCSADRYTGAWERELDETETIEDICALVQSITDGRVWFRRQLGLRTQYRTQKSTADIPTGRGWQRHPAY